MTQQQNQAVSAVIRELKLAQAHLDTAREKLRAASAGTPDEARDRRYAGLGRELQYEIDCLEQLKEG